MSSKPGRYIGLYSDYEDSSPLDVANGGTGVSSLTSDRILVGNGTNDVGLYLDFKYYSADEKMVIGDWDAGEASIERSPSFSSPLGIFSIKGAVPQAGSTNFTGGVLNLYGGGSSGTGVGGNIDFYTSPAGGSGTTINTPVLRGSVTNSGLYLAEDSTLIFEGATDNSYETTLTVENPTDDRTITLPDATGTAALTQKTIVIDRASWWSNAGTYFIPFDYFTESTSLSTASYRNFHVAPYDGRIVRLASFHQSTSTRNSTLELYIDGDDSDPVADQRGSDLSSGSHTQKFQVDCPADWTFSKGEALSIRRTDDVATYGCAMSIVFEYDITT